MGHLLTNQLKPISYLFEAKEREVLNEIKRVRKDDITSNLPEVSTAIKRRILLVPISLDEYAATLTGRKLINVPPYGQREAYRFKITVKVTGSQELLNYHPLKSTICGSNLRVFTSSNGHIETHVDIGVNDDELAMQQAISLLDTTYDLIRKNNAEITEWNIRIDAQIDQQLKDFLQ